MARDTAPTPRAELEQAIRRVERAQALLRARTARLRRLLRAANENLKVTERKPVALW